MLTDPEVAELGASFVRPPRNFTPQQWRAIAERLPTGATPTREALLALLMAANSFWQDVAAGSAREQARELTEAIENLRDAMERLERLAPHRGDELERLALPIGNVEWDRDQARESRRLASAGAKRRRKSA